MFFREICNDSKFNFMVFFFFVDRRPNLTVAELVV